jgi:hypothetical protein
MPKFVYVQVKDVPQAAKIKADKVEKVGNVESAESLLVIKSGSHQVGEFRLGNVHGWWIQDEPGEGDDPEITR